MTIKMISASDKDMANGMRNTTKTPLTEDEINFVKSEIKRIDADESVFVFKVVYGYGSNERKITREFEEPRYVSENGQERAKADELHDNSMRKVRRYTRSYDDFER